MVSISDNLNIASRTLPSTDEIDNFIHELLSVKLENVAYHVLYERLSNFLMPFPIFRSTLKVGTNVERARLHSMKGKPWSCEKDINFRTDLPNIVNYGRANLPHQSTFYGAVDTEETKLARVTLLHEIHPDFRKKTMALEVPSYMTVGQWLSTQPLNLVDIIFDDNSRLNSERIKTLYEYHERTYKPIFGERYDDVMKVMRFISNQFAKSVEGNTSGYMISAAYYNFVVENSNGSINGITYPSVQTNLQGANIVITPYYAQRALKLNKAIEIEISQTGEKEFLVDIPKICSDFGPLNSNFKWYDAYYSDGMTGVVQFTPST